MELKSTVQVRVTKSTRDYSFLMPVGAPLGEAYDVCHEILREIVKMANEAAERSKQLSNEGES